MATAVLRAGLVVAAVVLGVFVLSKAFPSAGDSPPVSTPEQTPTGEATDTGQSPAGQMSPTQSPQTTDPSEVTIQVLNATEMSGLAADVAEMLEAEGYDIRRIADAQSDPDKTTLFYAPKAEADAQALKDTFFPTAVLEKADPEVPVDVTIVLAEDYSAPQGEGSPAEASP